jgi:hypothetical protein
MRLPGLVALGFLLTIAVGALWRALPFVVVAPSVPIVIATYLGVTARERLATATCGAIALGYLGDILGGVPLGLGALAAGIACVLSRAVTLRLLLRGRGFLMGLTFAMHLCLVAVSLVARAQRGVPMGAFGAELVAALGSALTSAALAVPLVVMCRALDARFARTQRERDAVREGWLN